MADLTGKVAVVTGGASGIGLASAQALRAAGAEVVIIGRSEEGLSQAREVLNGEVLTIQADVSKLTDMQAAFAAIGERTTGIDVLLVNAGIVAFRPLEMVDEAFIDEMLNINFKGAFFTIQQALPLLRQGASIILTGSIQAHISVAGGSIYSASKAALHSLARTLAPELIPRKIRINTLNLGPINTPVYTKLGMPQEMLAGMVDAIKQRMPVGRFGEAAEIARAVLFLASDDSSFVMGSELSLDGGLSLNRM